MANQELHGATVMAREEGREGGPLTAGMMKAQRESALALENIHGLLPEYVYTILCLKQQQWESALALENIHGSRPFFSFITLAPRVEWYKRL